MSYKDLKSYQQATIVYDFTFEFCNRYIDKRSRTHDQMVQAARSGKQNTVEGSSEKTSEKSELKLIGIARGSLQKLLEDYEDYLRQNGLKQWGKDGRRAIEIRNLSYMLNRSYLTYESYIGNQEAAANVAICLIHQTNYLLDRQIKTLENEFVLRGGYNENLTRKRNEEKKRDIIQNFWRKQQ
ncbi:MAG: four helix bundle protein [Candidatus Liptonbacteria bacterium]|nr:four helix bundle protein [Candidatus Liptonbacteria bacterium]